MWEDDLPQPFKMIDELLQVCKKPSKTSDYNMSFDSRTCCCTHGMKLRGEEKSCLPKQHPCLGGCKCHCAASWLDWTTFRTETERWWLLVARQASVKLSSTGAVSDIAETSSVDTVTYVRMMQSIKSHRRTSRRRRRRPCACVCCTGVWSGPSVRSD